MRCTNQNPWDAAIRCELEPDHDQRHRAVLAGDDIQRWSDFAHFPGDSCGPNSHPATDGAVTEIQGWYVTTHGQHAHLVDQDGASVCGLVNVETDWHTPDGQPRCEACRDRAEALWL